jgi:hypothetical protein
VFIGGAASLFIATVLVENNAAWFPAISRANKFIANSKKQEQQVSTACTLLRRLLLWYSSRCECRCNQGTSVP